MSRIFRLLAFAVALSASAWPARAEAAAGAGRVEAEARRLFAVVLRARPVDGRCAVENAWLRYDVPAELARRAFGGNATAGLAALSLLRAKPADILDPGRKRPGVFCGAEQAAAGAAGGSDAPGDGVRFVRRAYAAPVFDRAFRVAVVLVSTDHCLRARAAPMCDGGLVAQTWRRGARGWRFTGATTLATWQ